MCEQAIFASVGREKKDKTLILLSAEDKIDMSIHRLTPNVPKLVPHHLSQNNIKQNIQYTLGCLLSFTFFFSIFTFWLVQLLFNANKVPYSSSLQSSPPPPAQTR